MVYMHGADSATPTAFEATVVPLDFVSSNTVTLDAPFEVDWKKSK